MENHFAVMLILGSLFLISITEGGWILNPEGTPGQFVRPDSYLYVKDGSSEDGKENSFSRKIPEYITGFFFSYC